jgi:hypothetical protein
LLLSIPDDAFATITLETSQAIKSCTLNLTPKTELNPTMKLPAGPTMMLSSTPRHKAHSP